MIWLLLVALIFSPVGAHVGSSPCFIGTQSSKRQQLLDSNTRLKSKLVGSASYVQLTPRLRDTPSNTHVVDGVVCREIPLDLPVVGTVTVLEATAESQEDLVDMALFLEGDDELTCEMKLTAGDPYGAVLWPAAWAVANYLLTTVTKQTKLQELSILELGTGTGLVSIAAMLGGAKQVLATDYEPLALELTKYAAKKFQDLSMETQLLDMCDYQTPLPPSYDVVVAADIMYEPKTGIAMAHRVAEALKQGRRVIVGDSPGRAGRPAFLKALTELGVSPEAKFVDTIGRTCSGPRHDLMCGKGSTSVSDTPKELNVAIMDLDPSMLLAQ